MSERCNRRTFVKTVAAGSLAAPVWAGADVPADQAAETHPARLFARPPDDCRLLLYYWWFGPSQTEEQVGRELEAMRQAGIGGVFLFPVYPLSADDKENYPYLSDRFLQVLKATVKRARELSLTVDLLLGGGWPFGGPTIRLEKSSRTLRKVPRAAPLGEAEERLVVDERSGAAFISAPTRQRVKSAVLGVSGWVLDHLDRGQVEEYLRQFGEPLLKGLHAGSLRSLNFDSLEAFGQRWTPSFLTEFRARRGYDLVPHLPSLWEDGETTPHVRHDYWLTVADLALDHFVKPLRRWCRQRGVPLQGKPMGAPIMDLRCHAEVDLTAAEEYDWLEFCGPRWAASGAHVYGQNLVANEAYCWLRRPRYITSLQDLKVGSDVNFLAGVNVLIGHGFSYSPERTGVPGWSYYAGVFFSPKNPWWPYLPRLSAYVQRVSFVLRQGRPVADVALYLPEDDVMADTAPDRMDESQKVLVKKRLARPGDRLPQFGLETALTSRSPLVSTVVTNGYSLDGINNEALQKAKLVEGRLTIGHGSYSVLVLPEIKGLPLESMKKLAEFVKVGGKVIAVGRTPTTCYGLREGWRERGRAVKELADSLFGQGGAGLRAADADGALLRALKEAHPPDVDFRPADPWVGFVHRKTSDHDFYFIANTSGDAAKELRATFQVGRRQPELWDPMTGATRVAPDYTFSDGGTTVPLVLQPYQSAIVVFGRSAEPPPKPTSPTDRRKLPPVLRLGGRWQLEIEKRSVELGALKSWTEHEAFRYFSGAGTYQTEFTVGKEYLVEGVRLELWLGRVHEIAEVEVNGKAAGVAWMMPHRLDVTGLLRAGRNRLRVKVTNLLINRVLGQPAPDVAELVKKYGHLCDPADNKATQNQEKEAVKAPLPSGLLGPVEVRPV